MIKTINFIFAMITVQVKNTDQVPNAPFFKDWDEQQQEIFDQLDDSGKFTKDQLKEISEMDTKDFLKCLRDEDEDENCYNRARAIWEYKTELLLAIKQGCLTVEWAEGLDAMRNGESAERFNY